MTLKTAANPVCPGVLAPTTGTPTRGEAGTSMRGTRSDHRDLRRVTPTGGEADTSMQACAVENSLLKWFRGADYQASGELTRVSQSAPAGGAPNNSGGPYVEWLTRHHMLSPERRITTTCRGSSTDHYNSHSGAFR